MKKAAVLWTGGKDCTMALHEAAADGYHVCCLATFAPPRPAFLAHPLAVIRLQAQALRLPHHLLTVEAPFEQGYESALRRLCDTAQVDSIITGDLAPVDQQPHWIGERCRALGLSVHTPLWGRDRGRLLDQLLARGYRVIFSCVDTRWLDAELVGRELTASRRHALEAALESRGGDLGGEQGEYHTLVVDGPSFRRPVELGDAAVRRAGPLAYLHVDGMRLAASAIALAD